MRTPKGMKLLVVDKHGTVVQTIEIGDTDLSKPLARSWLLTEIAQAITT